MSEAEELANMRRKWTSAECMDAAAELRRLQAENDRMASELARPVSGEVSTLLAERSKLIWENEHIKAENEALRKDAERYRWLKEYYCPEVGRYETPIDRAFVYDFGLDDAIDTAMKGTP